MLSCGSTEIDHVLFANAGESVFYHRIKVNETEFPLTFKSCISSFIFTANSSNYNKTIRPKIRNRFLNFRDHS